MRVPFALACLLPVSLAFAQNAPGGRTTLDVYSPTTSRELFSACDGDSDDRLDVFEAGDALETVHGPTDAKGFAAIDSNRDGYITWPEFDALFKLAIQRGNTFRVQTCRQFVQASPELATTRDQTPLQKFVQLVDKNRNGALDPDEIDQFVQSADLPPALSGMLRTLDLDRSGRLEAAELAPWFEQLRGRLPMFGTAMAGTTAANNDPKRLPPPWLDIDKNADNKVDADELARALQRIDPSLARWAPLLLKARDVSKNGALTVDELPNTSAPTADPAGSHWQKPRNAVADAPQR